MQLDDTEFETLVHDYKREVEADIATKVAEGKARKVAREKERARNYRQAVKNGEIIPKKKKGGGGGGMEKGSGSGAVAR